MELSWNSGLGGRFGLRGALSAGPSGGDGIFIRMRVSAEIGLSGALVWDCVRKNSWMLLGDPGDSTSLAKGTAGQEGIGKPASEYSASRGGRDKVVASKEGTDDWVANVLTEVVEVAAPGMLTDREEAEGMMGAGARFEWARLGALSTGNCNFEVATFCAIRGVSIRGDVRRISRGESWRMTGNLAGADWMSKN